MPVTKAKCNLPGSTCGVTFAELPGQEQTTLAAVMTTSHSHPSQRRERALKCSSVTSLRVVSITTRVSRGEVITSLITTCQNSYGDPVWPGQNCRGDTGKQNQSEPTQPMGDSRQKDGSCIELITTALL